MREKRPQRVQQSLVSSETGPRFPQTSCAPVIIALSGDRGFRREWSRNLIADVTLAEGREGLLAS